MKRGYKMLQGILLVILALGGFVALVFAAWGLILIGDDKVGILTKKMFGKEMPAGQIIARNGEIGIQAQTLMPGLYWRFPIFWNVEKVNVVTIGSGEIGVVESVDGLPLPTGQLLGRAIECNSFQDAKMFLDNGGIKGPQVGILRPGSYRINTKVFSVHRQHATRISKETIGVVVAKDGIPLPPGFIIAPKPEEVKDGDSDVRAHKFFQDSQAFLDAGGYRGPQLETLQPGEYYINPLLFNIEQYGVAEVPPGYVAVLRSNVGKELEKDGKAPTKVKIEPDLDQPIHEDVETLLNPDRDKRGILKDAVAPGKYNMNPIAYTPFLVPTSAITIDWAAGAEIRTDDKTGKKASKEEEALSKSEKAKEFFRFSQLRVTSRDGFLLDVDVRMIIRIRPEHAAFVIARFGSVANLIEQVVHPLIDSSFRNNAGDKKAIEFVRDRSKLQSEALSKAQGEFQKFHIEAQNLLIAYIDVDKTLLETQTKKEIAEQQREQYQKEAEAEKDRIQVQEMRAKAEKQPEVVAAQLSIEIAKNKAEAAREEAKGISDSTKTKADGEAYQHYKVGEGIAKSYEAQVAALGSQSVAAIKIVEAIAAGDIKITPDILVTGNDGNSGNVFNAWLATMMIDKKPDKAEKGKEAIKKDQEKNPLEEKKEAAKEAAVKKSELKEQSRTDEAIGGVEEKPAEEPADTEASKKD